jgi:NhaP-type Na+/H+ or K+/H+ antiporter
MHCLLLLELDTGTKTISMEFIAAALAIIGLVIIVSALLSGLIDRSGLPQVAVFLGLGLALGPYGLGLINLSLQSTPLHVVAILSLTLVLFTDAVALNISEVRRRGTLALRLLGPGTLLTAAIIALSGWWLLNLPFAAAAILGAALASTDPVLLRGVLRRRDIPADARHGLQLESGLNDAVLLPVVLVGIAVLNHGLGGVSFGRLAVDMFLLGPGAGVLIGMIAVAALDLMRKRVGIRRDYESLYSLGVAFTAFAAAEAVHGSGFLSAFAAGMTIAALDVELCDCFVEYGAVTAEMLLLFTFVLLGGSLIWSGLTVLNGPTLLFTLIAVMIRPPVYLISLLGSEVDAHGRLLIAWFGPRGLSSLLLILLPILAGVPGSEQLFPITSLVVLVSIVLHGGSPMLLTRIANRKSSHDEKVTVPVPVAGGLSAEQSFSQESHESCPLAPAVNLGAEAKLTAPDSDGVLEIGSHSISLAELKRLQKTNEPVTILDVRTERSLEDSNTQIEGALRMPPDHVVDRARELNLDKERWLIAYCA